MPQGIKVKAGVGLAAAAALVAGVVAASPAGATPKRSAVPSTKPNWLAHSTKLGAATKSNQLNLRVYLSPKGGEDALKAAVAAVSKPSSPSYRHFLTPAQYRAQFEPTDATVASVRSWLTSVGLHVTGVESSHRYVSVSGDVATAEQAFGVTLNSYRHDGQTVQAPAAPATVPTNVAGSVLTVTGLDTTQSINKPASIKPPASFLNARPCSAYWGQVPATTQADGTTPLPKLNGQTMNYAVCGYTGPQFRAAYEGNASLTGKGVTVAITDAYASPTIASDANKYATLHGDPAYKTGQLTQNNSRASTHTNKCGASGWFGEETLDVEAVHAMAPDANIRYYGAASCFDNDLLDTLNKVVDENIASVVTNSWGEPDSGETAAGVAAYTQTFLQAALQGITFAYSSGDNGDELANTGIRQSDSPASNPYVTAVGGTSTAIGANGTLAWQTGWGTQKYALSTDGSSWNSVGFLYGAGGGFSTLFNRPDYQNGVVPSSAPAGRAVPDVAMDADPTTGMLIGETQTFPDGVHYGEYRIGGTSLASPLFAGMLSLGLQQAGTRVGFLNPTVYGQAGSGTFLDVTDSHEGQGDVRVDYANSNDASNGLLYSIRTFDQDSSLDATPGWDDVTGVGVPAPSFLTSLG